ncbi:Z1 domain-containing protein [Brevibacillus borstelensis]|uniref:Z1 domain-containing protein n=1 Tax=Brevibacillus borstelensis TaxID=45462 RepID=UPI003CFA175A
MAETFSIDIDKESMGSWKVELFGSEQQQLESHFLHINEEERLKIFRTAAKILENCPDPKVRYGKRTGLALGKVQSGKTASFITLTAQAFDNGYRVVIILAGTKKNLLEQNTRRIKKQLGLDYRNDRKIAVLSTLTEIEDVREPDILGVLEIGNNVLITILKHPDHIAHLRRIFTSSELNHYPTLIIDDEGDQASLNTKVSKRGRSATYNEIIELKRVFNLHAYVAFTATPQANLLIKTIDELSPEFCVLIEPGSGYTGGSMFHGVHQDKYIRDVPEVEIPFEEKGEIPNSFIKALSIYLIGGAIRSLRGDSGQHSMLVHTSHKKDHHKIVGDRVKYLVENWKQKLLLADGDPGREGILSIIKECYIEEFYCVSEEYPTWERIKEQLRYEIKNLRLPWIVNSSKSGEVPSPDKIHLKNNIFIGGNMLDRGVTLDGLSVTYITRRARESQADTVEQRARWFGYKKDYLDICRIFAPVDVSTGFSDLLGHEDDLWDRIKYLESQGVNVKDWNPRLMQLSEQFKPTRTSVAHTKEFKISGWRIQNNPVIDDVLAQQNVNIVTSFFEGIKTLEKIEFGRVVHLVAPNCSLEYIINELLQKLHQNKQRDWDNILVQELLSRIDKTGRVIGIDVILMRPNEQSKRELNEKGFIKNLMQGKSVRISKDNPNFYPGDRDIHNNRVQLQIHIVSLHDENKNSYPPKTVLLALYIPEAVASEIGRLVVASEIK